MAIDNPLPAGYAAAADALTDRILALIPANPEILDMADCFDLFRIPGFECRDLQPTLAQASCALAKAKAVYRERNHLTQEPPCSAT